MTYSSGGKVLADERNTGREQAAGAQTQAKTLRKENLPVLGGEAGHHHAKDGQEDAQAGNVVKVAAVECAAAEDADKEQQEALDGADPRNGRKGRAFEERAGVVGLEDTKGVGHSPI